MQANCELHRDPRRHVGVGEFDLFPGSEEKRASNDRARGFAARGIGIRRRVTGSAGRFVREKSGE